MYYVFLRYNFSVQLKLFLYDLSMSAQACWFISFNSIKIVYI